MILYAPGVHTGGGKVLLDEVLKNADELHRVFPIGIASESRLNQVILDSRYRPPTQFDVLKIAGRVQPTAFARWQSEGDLARLAEQNPSPVLMFANVPPRLRMKNRTIVYLQNAFSVPGAPLDGLPIKAKLRLKLEKLTWQIHQGHADEVWVQTQFMVKLCRAGGLQLPIVVQPILPRIDWSNRHDEPAKYDFLCVANSFAYKRQIDYLQALAQLKAQGRRFCAALVTDSLSERENVLAGEMGDQLFVHQSLDHDKLLDLYRASRSLVNTSSIESFGLPLYEGQQAQLHIISCDAEYALESLSGYPNRSTFSLGRVDELAERMARELDRHPN
ncbi:MAG TPA: glycosyltransferase [Pseudobdellovibrionaceae bacterium]|nr:glycosyltransferase [Pseudobdellovibrionaceae bacterium]